MKIKSSNKISYWEFKHLCLYFRYYLLTLVCKHVLSLRGFDGESFNSHILLKIYYTHIFCYRYFLIITNLVNFTCRTRKMYILRDYLSKVSITFTSCLIHFSLKLLSKKYQFFYSLFYNSLFLIYF